MSLYFSEDKLESIDTHSEALLLSIILDNSKKYPAVQNLPRFLSLFPISLLNSAVSAITKSN